MNHRLSSSPRLGGRQRGSILLQVASALLVCVIALTGTELGYLFFVKREMQKAADLAALSGAKALATSDCVAGNAAATENAQQNLESLSFPVSVTPTCGRWDPAGNPGSRYFEAGAGQANAVEVLVSGTGPALLPFLSSRLVSARAMAKSGPPLAGFSVGTKLVNVTGNGLLGDSLKMLGLDLTGTSLVGYDGLADIKITPAGLLQELGIPASGSLTIGDLNALLTAQNVSLGNVLDATARAAGRTDLLSANTSLLNAVTTRLGGSGNVNQVRLGSDDSGSSRGLFAHVVSPDTSSASALSTQIRALDVINSAIGVASAGHAIDVSSLNINLLGLATVTTKVGVIEPPSIAFGSVGAKAYTAQVRSSIHLQTTNALLGGLLSPLVKLDLPIVVDVMSGHGTLAELCTTDLKDGSGNDRARITVESAIAKTCVGSIASNNLFSKSKACDENLSSMELLNVAGLLTVNNKINLNALASQGTVTLKEGETGSTGNEVAVGTTVSDLISQLTNLLFGAAPPAAAPSAAQLTALRDQIWNETASVCTATTPACRGNRLNAANDRVASTTSQSGLLSGVVNLVGGIVSGVLNSCTGLAYLGGTENGCKQMLYNTLAASGNSSSGGTVSNSLAYLTGLVKPLLNALGGSILTPLLQNVLGIQLGVTDVHLIKLQCSGEPRLVY